MEKESSSIILILVLVVGLFIISGLAIVTEIRYNNLVIDYNECERARTLQLDMELQGMSRPIIYDGG